MHSVPPQSSRVHLHHHTFAVHLTITDAAAIPRTALASLAFVSVPPPRSELRTRLACVAVSRGTHLPGFRRGPTPKPHTASQSASNRQPSARRSRASRDGAFEHPTIVPCRHARRPFNARAHLSPRMLASKPRSGGGRRQCLVPPCTPRRRVRLVNEAGLRARRTRRWPRVGVRTALRTAHPVSVVPRETAVSIRRRRRAGFGANSTSVGILCEIRHLRSPWHPRMRARRACHSRAPPRSRGCSPPQHLST